MAESSSPPRHRLSTRERTSSRPQPRAGISHSSSSSVSAEPQPAPLATTTAARRTLSSQDASATQPRTSIGHAVRVQLSSASPVYHGASKSRSAATASSSGPSSPARASTQDVFADYNQSSPHAHQQAQASPRMGSFKLSSVNNASPSGSPRQQPPPSPRVSSLVDSIARTGTSPRPVGRSFAADSPSSRSSADQQPSQLAPSPRKRPPAPLQLDFDRFQDAPGLKRSPKLVQDAPQLTRDEMPAPPLRPNESPSKTEARDTLSSLHTFSSAYLGTAIPSASLGVSSQDFVASSPRDSGPALVLGRPSASSSTHVSSSPPGSHVQSASHLSSPQAYGTRTFANFGLGLPFSASASANLSNLTGSSSPADHHFIPARNFQTKKASGENSREFVVDERDSFQIESPVLDRTSLVGLGELATPRWTSSVLERKWTSPLDVGPRSELEEGSRRSSLARRPSQEPMPTMSRKLSDQSPSIQTLPDSQTFAMHPTTLFPEVAAPKTPKSAPIGSSYDNGTFESGSVAFDRELATAGDSDIAGIADAFESMALQNRRSFTLTKQQADWAAPDDSDVMGLGFDYDAATAKLAETETPKGKVHQRRTSTGSTSSRRSSLGRSNSIEAKLPSKTMAVRRHSAGRNSFAHLPPSPAAPPTYLFSQEPPPPLPSTTNVAAPSAHSTPGKSADSMRHARQSHQSSPSIIAASILKHSREAEGSHVDIESAAAVDEGTAEALRKLDGLSSPRMSKVSSSTGSAPPAASRSRNHSRASDPSTPPALPRRDSEEAKSKRKGRSSVVTPSLVSAKDSLRVHGDGLKSSTLSVGGTSSAGSSPAIPQLSPSSPGYVPRSPLATSPAAAEVSPKAPPAGSRPSSSGNDGGSFVRSPPLKRGSASSTSVMTGVSASMTGSHDSPYASSITSTTNRSTSTKNRRGSIGSDISSLHSWADASQPRFERQDSGGPDADVGSDIPPVPPLPKDLESFRQLPTAASTTSLNLYTSPKLAHPHTEPGIYDAGSTLSSTCAEVPPQASRHAPRKWSISSAFHRAAKSPKTPAFPESASFTELASVGRDRKSSFHGHLSDARRMVSSSNDIVGLAAGLDRGREPRSRTTSQSSSSTSKTAATTATPAVVATSPGRSRSSLLNPRRTPSGIPFFSRKNSSPNVGATQTPVQPTEDAASDDRSGRKSILGLGFLRPSSSRKEKSSPSLKSGSMSSNSTKSPSVYNGSGFDEFGAKTNHMQGKASTVAGTPRRRGKTVGANDDHATLNIRPTQLPPMQVSPLPAQTIERIDSMDSLADVAGNTPAAAHDRVARLQASAKASLPTIVGSPSSKTISLQGQDVVAGSSVSPPPLSRTPTKIPRLLPQRGSIYRDASPSAPPSVPIRSKGLQSSRQQGNTPDLLLASGTSTSSSSNAASETESIGTDVADNEERQSKSLAVKKESQIPRGRSSTLVGTSMSTSLKKDVLDASADAASTSTPAIKSRRHKSFAPEESATPSKTHKSAKIASVSTSRLSSSGVPPPKEVSSVRKISVKGPDSIAASRRVSASSALQSSTSSLSSSTTRVVKNLASKVAGQTRLPRSSTAPTLSSMASDSGRSSTGSSRTKLNVTEDELLGDEEMDAYVKRQKASKAAAGASPEKINKMFEFPEPIPPTSPLDHKDALALYNRSLTPYEQDEIRQFESVYFVGPQAEKKRNTLDNPTNNYGYDDDRGDYLVITHDHIQYRYEIVDVLGKGSFGQVLQCRDHKTGEMVAIKIIRNKKRFHHQALVEIKVLENLVKWDPEEKHYVIRMVDSFTWRGHLCIVTELLSINLYELVKANSFAGFSTTLIRRFTIQILGSLSLLRHHRVVHCDLKPENILLKHPAKSAIKVIDFGSSCFEHEKVYTYIQSRFYRSPEVILGMNYHMAIDMWSLGCIIAEMYTGYPIFPGENEQEQLGCIMEVMGVPDKYLIDRSSRKRLFFDSTGAPRPVVNSKGRRRRPGTKSLAHVLKTDDDLFVDFIAKCLIWDPERRMKPDAALRHPWIVAARGRPISPAMPASRSNRSSLATSGGNSSNTSSPLPAISTPRRKVISIMNTSASTSSLSAAASSTNRARTQSSSASATAVTSNVAPARLSSRGSLGLPPSSHRYSVRSS
ncbi:serine/threonine protein kinase, CMGC, dual-specificity [Microbotryomycetes sp. JL201]|nr:serine/threonine protein kinase, CMGC, dual-specificity [Microbotryomycetes sp. JL201]